jgi:hypothetical protein
LRQNAANSEASSDFRLAFGAAQSVGRRHSNRYRGARPDVQSLEYLASMRRSSAFYDITVDERANAFAAEFVHGKIRIALWLAGTNMRSTRWRPPFALTRNGRPMRLALTSSRGQRPDYFQRLRNFER